MSTLVGLYQSTNSLLSVFKSENPLEKMNKDKELEEKIKRFFSDLLEEKGERLIVFIDELDRCKPSYAIKVLERIKHYFHDERITFVFSVNLDQLQHTIRHYYGASFDACKYLDRFFDLRISLPPAKKDSFFNMLGIDNNFVIDKVCEEIVEMYDMELRESTRYI